MKSISWADITSVKKAAKAAKNEYPELSHAQLLDLIARSEIGVRHFHELQARYKDQVASYIEPKGNIHQCRFCQFQFAADLPEDARRHNARHRAFEDAATVLKYLPLSYRELENIKKIGHALKYSDDQSENRLGVLSVFLAWHERSLAANIGNKKAWPKHPCFKEYVACMLTEGGLADDQIRSRLIEEFGESPGVIPQGQSYWPEGVTAKSGWSSDEAQSSRMLRAAILSNLQSNYGLILDTIIV